MSFGDFFHEHSMKSKATSTIKIQQILSFFCSQSERCEGQTSLKVRYANSRQNLHGVKIFSRDGPFKTDEGIVNLHPPKERIGSHTITKPILIHMADLPR